MSAQPNNPKRLLQKDSARLVKVTSY
jgi:hypothetical protein